MELSVGPSANAVGIVSKAVDKSRNRVTAIVPQRLSRWGQQARKKSGSTLSPYAEPFQPRASGLGTMASTCTKQTQHPGPPYPICRPPYPPHLMAAGLEGGRPHLLCTPPVPVTRGQATSLEGSRLMALLYKGTPVPQWENCVGALAARMLSGTACPVGFERDAKQRAASSSIKETGCGSVVRREGDRGRGQGAPLYSLFPAITPPSPPSSRTAAPTTEEQSTRDSSGTNTALTFDPRSVERDGCGGVVETDLRGPDTELCETSSIQDSVSVCHTSPPPVRDSDSRVGGQSGAGRGGVEDQSGAGRGGVEDQSGAGRGGVEDQSGAGRGGVEAEALEILAGLGRVLDHGDSKMPEQRDGAAGKERRKLVSRDSAYSSTSSDTFTMTPQDVAGRRPSHCNSDSGLGTGLGTGLDTGLGTGQQRRCPLHEEETVGLYCRDCWQLVCKHCALEQHADCRGLLPLSTACREVRWQLLKLQTCVGSRMKDMQGMVLELKPRVEELAKVKAETIDRVTDGVRQIMDQLQLKQEQALEQINNLFSHRTEETQSHLRSAERSLALLDVVKDLLETLRQNDSGVDLLQQFCRRLDWLTKKVLRTTQSQLLSENVDYPPCLDTCQEMAEMLVLDVIDSDTSETAEEDSVMRTNPPPAAVAKTDVPDEKVWPLSKDMDRSKIVEWGAWTDSLLPFQSCPKSTTTKEVDDLIEEVRDYLENLRNRTKSSTSTLYEDMMTPRTVSPVGPMDLLDEVFQHTSPQHRDSPADIFTCQPSADSCRVRVDLRMLATFPQDEGKSFVTDMHVTETGRLVYLDAANNALKCVHPRHPSTTAVSRPLMKPFSVCSAGWDRVMVSSADKRLSVYRLLGLELELVLTHSTDHQYRGLVRVSDALMAAACPETRTIDLLDFSGRLLRSIRPLDFARGPEVVGVTARCELLVVHQPATPPTTLVCCDMRGHVIWTQEMPTRARHVSCSKVVGAADGSVYYTLQGDSAIYRLHPDTGEHTIVLSSRQGIKFPSSMALDQDNRVVVTRNELPSVEQKTPDPKPILPITTEINFFIQEA